MSYDATYNKLMFDVFWENVIDIFFYPNVSHDATHWDEKIIEWMRKVMKKNWDKVVFKSIMVLLIAGALIVTLRMPVLQVCGNSMMPTLKKGEIVMLIKSDHVGTGDIIAFYYNNKIFIKRVIAKSDDWVDMTEDGTVLVNGKTLNEPYISELDYGECNLKLPYQVPDEQVFVMGDYRNLSLDSRSSKVGCVAKGQILGKLKIRIWPFRRIQVF